MRHHTTLGNICPKCNKVLDQATGVTGDAAPNPGDLSVCFTCGNLMKFSLLLTLESISDEDLAAMSDDFKSYIKRIQEIALDRKKGKTP